MNIYPIKKGTRNFIPVLLNLVTGTMTSSFLRTEVSTGARLHNKFQTLHNFTILSNHAFLYTLELDINLLDFNPLYPKTPENLGELIRKARLEKKMKEKELASLLKVNPTTIENWEIHNIIPSMRYLSKLEHILDIRIPASLSNSYCLKNPTTLGGKIKEKRLQLRLSQRELAEKLEVSADTIADWETDRHKPCGRNLSKIREFIQI